MKRKPIKFIHSFSTRSLTTSFYTTNTMSMMLCQMWYSAVSVAFLKRLGCNIELHTDSLGAAILGHIPYDKVHLTLDDGMEEINPRFWAAAKFFALNVSDAPVVHIDCDVFIKTTKCLESILDGVNNSDILVQSTDAAHMYSAEIPLFNNDKSFCENHFCVPDGKDAYNTGLLGFKDAEVKNAVVNNYLEIVRHFSKEYAEDLKNPLLTPDLIAEQKMVESFSEANNLRVNLLLLNKRDAIPLGYQHVYTVDKITALPLCCATLKNLDVQTYNRCKRISNGYPESFQLEFSTIPDFDIKDEEKE